MYGNNYGYYNPTRNIGVPTQPMNNQFIQQPQMPMNNYVQQPMVPTQMSAANGLLGKIVDDISVVKATEIPLDGSTSFFPLADGSSIITKKLGNNGSSEIVVYKPVIEETKEKEKEEDKPKYVTESYLNDKLEKLDNSNILNDVLTEIKELKEEVKEFKTVKTKERDK